MVGRVLAFSRTSTLPGGLEMGRYCDTSTTSAAKPLPSNMVMESRASAAGLGCVRGTTLALTFEAAAAVIIYGVCHLVSLLR